MSKRINQPNPPRGKSDPSRMRATIGGSSSWSPSAWLVAALLAFSLIAVYAAALNAPFIFDDTISIVRNKSIVSLWPLVGSEEQPGPLNAPLDLPTAARPLVNYSFALNYHFDDLRTAGYHAINLALHFCSTMLLWAIVGRALCLPYFADRFSTSAGWLAMFVAMLWALHPLQTETVIYATQRTELMMAFFYLATLYCSLSYWSADTHLTQRSIWLTLAVLACLAGMASKEVMVSAPLMILLFERTFIAGSLVQALRRSWPLYLGLASTWLLLLALNIGAPRSASTGFGVGPPALVWWATQCQVLLVYLKLAAWPWPLLIHYQMPYLTSVGAAWIYVLPVFLLGIITLALLWRNDPVGYLGTWMFAILSPTSVVPILTEMAAERRMYLPLAALVVLVVVAGFLYAQRVAQHCESTRPTALGIKSPLASIGVTSLVIAVIFAAVSANRLNTYHNPIALWEEVVRFQPEDSLAHENIGFHLEQAGNVADAILQLRQAIQLNPKSAQAHYSLAVLLTKTGANDEAAAQFAAALRIRPKDFAARVNLAAALIEAGRYGESIAVSRETLELSPNNWIVYNNLATALQKSGKYDEAIEQFQQALRLNPDALDLYNDLADIYLQMKRPQDATAALNRGLQRAIASRDTAKIETFTKRLHANP